MLLVNLVSQNVVSLAVVVMGAEVCDCCFNFLFYFCQVLVEYGGAISLETNDSKMDGDILVNKKNAFVSATIKKKGKHLLLKDVHLYDAVVVVLE
jgi:hypothetical protein